MDQAWTINSILAWITTRFHEAKISTPRLDAQILLAHVLNVEKMRLYTHSDTPLTPQERLKLREFVKRRLDGEPVAYIVGHKHWYDMCLKVNGSVLIPRPETETLVDFVIESARDLNREPKVIFDLCTGSGCIALALAKRFPQAQVVAIDISPNALEIAKENAKNNDVDHRICFVQADVTDPQLYAKLKNEYGQAHVVTANPPYVSHQEWCNLDKTVSAFEPKLALVAENNGLALGQAIYQNINEFNLLAENAIFCMEMAENHPGEIVGEKLKKVSFLSSSCQKPLQEWFSLCDLENKARFLCRL